MTSGATTLETLHYAKIAARLGYDAQQVIPPYYWRCGEAEVERHYRMIAEAGDLPVVIYHNPALSKFNITPKFAGKLATIPGVVAFKEVLTDLQHLEALYDEVGRPRGHLQYVSRAARGPDARRGRRLHQYFRGAGRGRAAARRSRPATTRAPRKFSAGSIDASRAAARKRSAISAPPRSPRRSRPASRWVRRGRRT